MWFIHKGVSRKMSIYSDDKEFISCPQSNTKCGISDTYCRKCSYKLPQPTTHEPTTSLTPESEEKYEKKYSTPTRFIKMLTSPRDAMDDIAKAPDYDGVTIIIILQIILVIFGAGLALQKLQFTGSHQAQIENVMFSFLAITVVIAPFVFAIRWYIKSWIVKSMCDDSWDFSSAAAVTGYAYLASTILSILSVIVAWFFLPAIVLDTTNLDHAIILMEQHNAEMLAYQFMITLPLALVGMIWKSYLGGLGTNAGTRNKCSIGNGFGIFMLLGLIGLSIDFFL